jgi:hypothetical protein
VTLAFRPTKKNGYLIRLSSFELLWENARQIAITSHIEILKINYQHVLVGNTTTK